MRLSLRGVPHMPNAAVTALLASLRVPSSIGWPKKRLTETQPGFSARQRVSSTPRAWRAARSIRLRVSLRFYAPRGPDATGDAGTPRRGLRSHAQACAIFN